MAAYYKSRIPEDAVKVFEGVAHDVYHWQQELYDGSFRTFEVIKRLDGASVVAIKDDKIIMLKEEQPTHATYWATPGGHVERDDASPAEAIRRELLEETGMEFATIKLVRVDFIGNNRLEWFSYRFVATDLMSQVTPQPEAGERIEIFEVSLEEAQDHAANNPFASPSILLGVHSIQELKDLPEVQPLASSAV